MIRVDVLDLDLYAVAENATRSPIAIRVIHIVMAKTTNFVLSLLPMTADFMGVQVGTRTAVLETKGLIRLERLAVARAVGHTMCRANDPNVVGVALFEACDLLLTRPSSIIFLVRVQGRARLPMDETNLRSECKALLCHGGLHLGGGLGLLLCGGLNNLNNPVVIVVISCEARNLIVPLLHC